MEGFLEKNDRELYKTQNAGSFRQKSWQTAVNRKKNVGIF